MMKKHTPAPIDRRPDVVAIWQNQRPLFERDALLLKEAAAIYAARNIPGVVPEPIYDDHAKAVRAHVATLLNGHTPEKYLLPPETGREEAIRVEREAIEIVQRVHQSNYERALQIAAEDWVAKHKDEWFELARHFVLTSVRLLAIETRAREMAEEIRGQFVSGLPLAEHLGFGLSLLGAQDNPLREITADAVAEGVCTTAEIRKAENEF